MAQDNIFCISIRRIKMNNPVFRFSSMALSMLLLVPGQTFAAGMMDGQGMGMMRGGMMSQSPKNDQAASASINPKNADALLAYIHSNNLSCTQCHGISSNGFGPSFAAVSASYANRNDAVSVLEDHIEHGFGRMPSGLASGYEDNHLARMILDLTNSRDQ